MQKDTQQSPSLALIGAGKMGEILLSGLLSSQQLVAEKVVATARHRQRLVYLKELYGVRVSIDNVAAVRDSEVVFLCVKPQQTAAVLAEIAPVLSPDHLLVSIVAGWDTRSIEGCLAPGVPVVRAMPNTPSRVGEGMTSICGGVAAGEENLARVQRMLQTVGRCMVLEERTFDAVTGLSASGPAFIYIVIEAMAEGGVKMGLPRSVATELAAQTCLGAAKMTLDTGHHPALLKDEVTTPAGCTIDGILKLEEGGLRVTLIKAIVEASRRAGDLADD